MAILLTRTLHFHMLCQEAAVCMCVCVCTLANTKELNQQKQDYGPVPPPPVADRLDVTAKRPKMEIFGQSEFPR